MKPAPRVGWMLVDEPRPSLCKHWLPKAGEHRLTNTCWCQPLLQGEPVAQPPYTIVHHNDFARA